MYLSLSISSLSLSISLSVYIYIYIYTHSKAIVTDNYEGPLTAAKRPEGFCVFFTRNLLGWLRLGWLKIT